MLMGIILLPLLARFSLICRMWAFQIIHDRPLERADWAFVLGWSQGPECFIGCTSSLGLVSGSASPFFRPYQDLMTFSFIIKFICISSLIDKIFKILKDRTLRKRKGLKLGSQ